VVLATKLEAENSSAITLMLSLSYYAIISKFLIPQDSFDLMEIILETRMFNKKSEIIFYFLADPE